MVAMDATKGRGKPNIFTCLNPPAVDDDHSPGCASPPLPFSADARRKKRLRRSFSAAFKAVLFKTSLLKKSRSENFKQDEKLKHNLLFKSKKIVNSMKKSLSCKPLTEPPPKKSFRSNSDRSSLFSSNQSSRTPSLASSSASSCSSHSRSGSDKIKPSDPLDFKQLSRKKTLRKDSGRKCGSSYYPTIEICVVWLLCLFALIWGKVFAIVICTTAWLLLSPANRRSASSRPPLPFRRNESFDVIDSECKKRVIMEGLLERKR